MSADPEARPLKRFAFSLIKQTGSLLCCRESRPSAGMPAVAVGACVTESSSSASFPPRTGSLFQRRTRAT